MFGVLGVDIWLSDLELLLFFMVFFYEKIEFIKGLLFLVIILIMFVVVVLIMLFVGMILGFFVVNLFVWVVVC